MTRQERIELVAKLEIKKNVCKLDLRRFASEFEWGMSAEAHENLCQIARDFVGAEQDWKAAKELLND